MSTKYNRGSEWRKWDLHIHSTASDGKLNCEEIIELAITQDIKCIALTDHHTFANVDILKSIATENGNQVSVITGVEFRTEYGNKSVHMIGLFPDKYDGIELTAQYLHDNILSVLGISRSQIIEKARKADTNKNNDEDYYFHKGWNLVQVDFREAANLIHKYGGLVSVHAGSKSNSIDEEMKHEGTASKNVSIYDSLGPVKDELFRDGYIDICEIRNDNDSQNFYWETFHKPSITASDTHERHQFGRGFCWVKADCNFYGLRQILEEPDRISFSKPNLLERIECCPSKFIKNITINKKIDSIIDEIWYDNISIDINPGLVAIIGNKGSGKSAITDIIGLCANTHNNHWSFLTKSKFRMSRPYNRSSSFHANIKWYDGSESGWKGLDTEVDMNMPERVKYIPQNFLENLCTTEDEKDFEQEMKSIIFQYLPDDKKYDKQSLDEIVSYLSKDISSTEQTIRQQIEKINEAIIVLEDKKNPNYKKRLENALALKQQEYTNLLKVKPQEIQRPNHSDSSEIQKQEEIIKLRNQEKIIDENISNSREKLNELTKRIQDITNLRDTFDRLEQTVKSTIQDVKAIVEFNGIDCNSIITLTYKKDILDCKIADFVREKNEVEKVLDATNESSWLYKKEQIQKQIKEQENKLSEPERVYQQYLQDLKIWAEREKEIKGSIERPDTILFYQEELSYIENKLIQELNAIYERRNELALSLIKNKRRIIGIYTSLYEPISQFINEYREDLKSYPMALDATFVFDNNINERFFTIVSQQFSGTFYGKEQGALKLKELCDTTDLNDDSQILFFAQSVNDSLQIDKRDGFNNEYRDMESQLKKGHTKLELYNFLYCFSYIDPLFQLKLSGKELSALSPGERGALLLLFYLFIDMDDKPLIIDQPEENLDNESVFDYLVTFIKKAKVKRQIIIVTHNPNLAVVCDADQIIKMNINKKNKNAVSFESGAIENPLINEHIVNILEGTYPAFHNRDSKYFKAD